MYHVISALTMTKITNISVKTESHALLLLDTYIVNKIENTIIIKCFNNNNIDNDN